MERLLTMSQKEIARFEAINKVLENKISKINASKKLNITTRHLRRLCNLYRRYGAQGLISKRRGRPSNNKLKASREDIIKLITSKYMDFGPTLAHEKLTRKHGYKISVESLRKIMISSGIWQGKSRKKITVHQMRPRRHQYGELVQIDGSPHAWFEDRADSCCLHVFVDDATGKIMALHFAQEECTDGYFTALGNYISNHGIPANIYSDRHSIFRVNTPEANSGTGETQFGRALKDLNISLICANSPQAKGRVERVNKTLQDRLVKELRLANIKDISSANAFLPKFIEQYNNLFAVQPHSDIDAHNKHIPEPETLKLILSQQYQRKISKNLEVSFDNKIYQIQVKNHGYTMRKANLTVCSKAGEITLLYKNNLLDYKVFDKGNRPTPVASSKQLTKRLNKKKVKPAADHPWRAKYPNYLSQIKIAME